MHLNETETLGRCLSVEPELASAKPLVAKPFIPVDPIALEAIVDNLEASLRIFTDRHFFAWTQGLLQNLIKHEVLICSLRKGDSELSLVESFSTTHTEPKHFSRLYHQDVSLTERLVKHWEAHHFQPVLCDTKDETLFPDSELVRELTRIGATRIIAHGMHDSSARMMSFFVFACLADDADQTHMVELLIPSLHAAWMRTKINHVGKAGENSAHSAGRDLLTAREQEVLRWVYLGKSNIEIGLILGISPLTVKNHVQEILRRLNVQNRTQAVGKAFNLHILSC